MQTIKHYSELGDDPLICWRWWLCCLCYETCQSWVKWSRPNFNYV